MDTDALEQNLRFPGQWFQAETGLHQNWMRDYDPTTGRYLQADPLGLVDGPSVYGYARQSPVRYTDPTGENTIVAGAGIGGAIAGPPGVVVGAAAGAVVAVAIYGGYRLYKYCTGDGGDPCVEARQRLAKAKERIEQLGRCKPGMSKIELQFRYAAWQELARARSNRDNVCHGGPDATHQGEINKAVAALKVCRSLLFAI